MSQHSVYICHAPEDLTLGQEFAEYLVSRNLTPALPAETKGPLLSEVMVVLFTEATNKCPEVLRDFKIATEKRIPIVGLRIAVGFLSNELDALNPHVEWITAIIGKPQDHFPKLADQVAIHLKGVHVAAHLETDAKYRHREEQRMEEASPVVDGPAMEILSVTDDAPPVAEAPSLPSEMFAIMLVSAGDNKIGVIQGVREVTNLDLAEAKELVERGHICVAIAPTFEEAKGVANHLRSYGAMAEIRSTATDQVISEYQGVMEAPPRQTGANQVDLLLTSPGVQILQLIKVVRGMTGLGLAESKNLVESPMPVTLARLESRESAEQLRDSLYAAGAMADIVPASPATAPNFRHLTQPVPKPEANSFAIGCIVIGFIFLVCAGIVCT